MEVTIGFHYCSGDIFVDEVESKQIAIQHYEVNGHWIPAELATLRNHDVFLVLECRSETLPADEGHPYILRGLSEISALRDELGPEDWLDAINDEPCTTDDLLVLPVSSMKWIDMNLVPA